MTCMRSGGFVAVLLVAGMIVLGGCASSSPTGPTATTATTGQASSFCQALKEASGSDLTLTSKAAWDQRLALTAALVALAPLAQQANAQVYWSSQDSVDTPLRSSVSRFELVRAHAVEVAVPT